LDVAEFWNLGSGIWDWGGRSASIKNAIPPVTGIIGAKYQRSPAVVNTKLVVVDIVIHFGAKNIIALITVRAERIGHYDKTTRIGKCRAAG
jgi:hypothetical protein